MTVRIEVLNPSEEGPRLGVLHTPHGAVRTPVFMPVGTQATVKALTPSQVKEVGVGLLLANTYHLHLRPGTSVVKALGGIHRFMGWDGAVLTDSGGFQVFSLSDSRRISEAGVTFRSHIDGSSLFIGPEESIASQHNIGADIMMCFDECIAYPASRDEAAAAAQRTYRWAGRCLETHLKSGSSQSLFGIVQGSVYSDLRRKNADELVSLGFPGYAIGGLSVGEPRDLMYPALRATCERLPVDRPRYLMGVGTPEDIIEGVRAGVDMFDCVLPTRIARHATALTYEGRLLLKAARRSQEDMPIEEGCDCYTCRNFSRAYLRHLFKAAEPLAYTLASIHNLRFMARFMRDLQQAIADRCFLQWVGEFRGHYARLISEGDATAIVEPHLPQH